MSKAIRQHWVPRFYLKHFATSDTKDSEDPKVFRLAKDGKDFRSLVSVRNIAVERHLYTPKNASGTRDWAVEDDLASLESLAADLWRRFATDMFDYWGDQTKRKFLSLFIGSMILRHPDAHALQKRVHQQIIDTMGKLPKDRLACDTISVKDSRGKSYKLDLGTYPEFKAYTDSDLQKLFAEGIKKSAAILAELLMERRWSMLVSEAPAFVTSDRPVVILHPTILKPGIRTPGAVLIMPITPHKLLFLDDHTERQSGLYYGIETDDAVDFSIFIWKKCQRFLCAPRDPFFVIAAYAQKYSRYNSLAKLPVLVSRVGL